MRTLELRWWIPIGLDEHMLTAFADGGRLEARADLYLLGTGAAIGVKRRGAAELLERKRRLTVTPISIARDNGEALDGVAEAWHKTWPERAESPASSCWVTLDKLRALRRVGACRAELTRVSAAALPCSHSTLAIETAGVDSLDALRDAATELLRTHPRLAAAFARAKSAGYPAWIVEQGARWGSNPQPTG